MTSSTETPEIINSLNNLSVNSNNDNYKENAIELRFSEILFTDSDKDSIGLKFVMKPCPERRQVRKLIEFGGGVMTPVSDCHSDNAIHLVTTNAHINDKSLMSQTYYYCKYVYDCCEANELLDLNQYRFKTTTTITRSSDQEDSEDNAVNEVIEWHFDEQDLKIISYITRRKAFADICGNRLWAKALDDGVSYGHTWESTKDRFLFYIMPNIDKYSIDDLYKQKFKKYYNLFNDKNVSKKTTINHNSNPAQKSPSIPDIVMTDSPTKPTSESNVEEIDDKTKDNESLEESRNLKETNDSNEEVIQTEPVSKKRKSTLNSDLIESMSESESDNNSNTETKSKYFKVNKSKQKKNKSQKPFLNTYLEFVKQRETMSSPENLLRIKQSLKSVKNDKNSVQSTAASTSRPTQKCITFGAKVMKNFNERQPKEGNEIETQETGYKVSDISSDDSSDIEMNVLSNKFSKSSLHLSKNKMQLTKQKHQSLYDLNEDELIIRYVLKSKRFDELKGNSLWEKAENENVCKGRSWQSMKERFRKHIMPNIDLYEFPKKDKSVLKKFFYFERESDVNRSFNVNNGYTDAEDDAILKYIIKKNAFDSVMGNKIWQQMEKEFKKGQSLNRSWQSMKERYRKRIITHLNKYRIKIEIVNKILNGVSNAWMSDKDKIGLINKCKKVLINIKQSKEPLTQRPQTRPLELQVGNNSDDSNTEIEDQ